MCLILLKGKIQFWNLIFQNLIIIIKSSHITTGILDGRGYLRRIFQRVYIRVLFIINFDFNRIFFLLIMIKILKTSNATGFGLFYIILTIATAGAERIINHVHIHHLLFLLLNELFSFLRIMNDPYRVRIFSQDKIKWLFLVFFLDKLVFRQINILECPWRWWKGDLGLIGSILFLLFIFLHMLTETLNLEFVFQQINKGRNKSFCFFKIKTFHFQLRICCYGIIVFGGNLKRLGRFIRRLFDSTKNIFRW